MAGDVDLQPVDMPDLLEDWRTTIDYLDQCATALAEAGDTPRLAFGLDRVRELRRALGDLERGIEGSVAELMAGKTETVDGLGTLERRKGTDRKAWQSQDLLKAIVLRSVEHAIDTETGEVPSATELVAKVVFDIEACAPFTGSTGWRVTALRARDFDPDEWAETKPGRTSVQIHRPDAA